MTHHPVATTHDTALTTRVITIDHTITTRSPHITIETYPVLISPNNHTRSIL